MEGSLEDPELHGVIPRAAQAIFDNLSSSRYVESQVSCSYLEIYNEELSDLLVSGSTKLDIVNAGGSKGVQCRGLSEQPVESALDVLNLMQQAQQSRRVGETRMNKQSSRSHCIFTMKISSTQVLADGSTLQSQGKLHMVDLAGSESAKTAELKESSVRDQIAREQERRNINQSLLTLGKVITSLKKKSKAIPYR